MSNRWKINDVQKLRNSITQITAGTDYASNAIIGAIVPEPDRPDKASFVSNTRGGGNIFDNSGFEIAQRGATQTGLVGAPRVRGADRWCTETVTAAVLATSARGLDTAFTDGQDGEYLLKIEGTDTGFWTFGQMLNPGKELIGHEITMSMEIMFPSTGVAVASTGTVNFAERADSAYLRDGTQYEISPVSAFTTDVWYRFSITLFVPSYTTYMHYGVSFRDLSTTTAGVLAHIRRPQLYVGDGVPEYSKPSTEEELRKCLKHCYVTESLTAANKRTPAHWRGDITSGAYYIGRFQFPEPMYKAPVIGTTNFNFVTQFNTPYFANIGKETADLVAQANANKAGAEMQGAFIAEAEYFP